MKKNKTFEEIEKEANSIRMLKDLEIKEVKEILFKNTKMMEKIASAVIQYKMEEQEECGRLMLGNNFHKYIELRDNYNSFFLRLKDWNKFFNNLDYEYLNIEGVGMYEKIKKDIEIYENEEDEDKRYEQEEQIEKELKLPAKVSDSPLMAVSKGCAIKGRNIVLYENFEKKSNGLYIFKCTEFQLIAYLFKFGKDAQVISPLETREKMKEKYKQAYDEYINE